MSISQDNKDKLLLRKIELSNNYNWLINLLKNSYPFSNTVLNKIKQIHSIEINNLILKNYK